MTMFTSERSPEMPTITEPSGRPSWPFCLVEGMPKTGSTVVALLLSRSPHVRNTYHVDLRDDVGHEYAALGPYKLVEPDGGRWTLSEIEAAVRMATTQPRKPGDKPDVVVLDKGTHLWEMLGDRARMRAEKSKAGRKALQEDPDAEVNIGHTYWNDAGARWTRITNMLRSFPGIGVIVCEGEEITKFANGQPTTERTWKVKADKSLPAIVDAWVRMSNPGHRCHVIGVRSLTWEGRDMVDAGAATDVRGFRELPNTDWRVDNPLETLIFDVIAAGREFEVRRAPQTEATLTLTEKQGKARFLAGIHRTFPHLSEAEAKAEAGRLWTELVQQHVDSDEVESERVDGAVAMAAARAGVEQQPEDEYEVGDSDRAGTLHEREDDYVDPADDLAVERRAADEDAAGELPPIAPDEEALDGSNADQLPLVEDEEARAEGEQDLATLHERLRAAVTALGSKTEQREHYDAWAFTHKFPRKANDYTAEQATAALDFLANMKAGAAA